AVPGGGAKPELWILGSSLYGAQLAAALGLPYAFASHFAPGALDEALEVYRRQFRPSAVLDKPYAMAGFNVFAADTDAQAELLASSMQQAFVALRTTGIAESLLQDQLRELEPGDAVRAPSVA
ncbi:LLM class flavin-dependent oxidoreductase, partial [Klebsiella pneumoniae]|uniref:LLM class flavin-dependent oxidoreductase n=1 Tax=Klebsiella pneumoniae TaxID=573 RepID=UPI003A802A4E